MPNGAAPASRRASGQAGLPPGPPPSNHGKTSAAWVTTLVVSLGALVCALGMMLSTTPVTVLGVVAILAGLVVGRVMRAMGLGQSESGSTIPPSSQSAPRR